MKKIKEILSIVGGYFKKKGVGFYLTLAALILSIASLIIYSTGYSDSKFYTSSVIIVLAVAIAVSAVCAVFKITAPLSPVVLGLLNLLSFCLFIKATYMYLTEVFYGGISKEAIQELDKAFVLFLLFSLICVILCVVSVFMEQNKVEPKLVGEEAKKEAI